MKEGIFSPLVQPLKDENEEMQPGLITLGVVYVIATSSEISGDVHVRLWCRVHMQCIKINLT